MSFGHPHHHIARVIDAGVRNNWEEPTGTLAYVFTSVESRLVLLHNWITCCSPPRISQSTLVVITFHTERDFAAWRRSAVNHIYNARTFAFHWLILQYFWRAYQNVLHPWRFLVHFNSFLTFLSVQNWSFEIRKSKKTLVNRYVWNFTIIEFQELS